MGYGEVDRLPRQEGAPIQAPERREDTPAATGREKGLGQPVLPVPVGRCGDWKGVRVEAPTSVRCLREGNESGPDLPTGNNSWVCGDNTTAGGGGGGRGGSGMRGERAYPAL